jgi:thioredoxin-related protein
MLYFHASKSKSMAKNCSTLDRLTFRQKGVTSLSRQFHSVRLDATKVDKALLKRFKVKTAPTVVFIDKNGKPLKKVSGKSATSAKVLVAVMKAVLKKNKKTKSSSSFASTVGKPTSKKGEA